jgi:hypothetical protein
MDSPATIAISLASCFLLVALMIAFTAWYYQKGSAAFAKALKENSFAIKRKVLYGYTALFIDTVNRNFAVQSAVLDETGKRFAEPSYDDTCVRIFGYGSLLACELVRGGGGRFQPIRLRLTVMDGSEREIALLFAAGMKTVLPFNPQSYLYASGIAGRMLRELQKIMHSSRRPD